MAPAPSAELADFLRSALASASVDFSAWLRAWARVMPALVLVPAFGGAALPVATRAGLGCALAVAIAPALRPVEPVASPLALQLLREAARGAPVAISAALLVHTALMAGGVIDDLRGARESGALPVFEGEHTPFGAVLGLLVAIGLLESGGAARLVAALSTDARSVGALTSIVEQLAASVGLAVAVAVPIAAATVVVSVAEALIARAAAPAHVSALLSPLRGVALLAVAALSLDRIAEILLLAARR
ncbi:MAG TPA: flagellar biosynthetic protein FliR [Polyangiaceae bacterium]|nr:flagellar biosynthetic protein FliR [Polyangiaceae bacterium]